MPDPPNPLCNRELYAGKHVLVTGGSGFLGKVFIALLLEYLPDIGRIYVFMRPKALVSGETRFENMLNTSPAFRSLHERFGAELSTYLEDKLEVVEGELDQPDLGFSPQLARRLRRDLHLFVHSAGLVDFNPDLGKALSSNVDSTLRAADFVQSCSHARLLHISTCYVAGRRSGFVPECVVPNYSPNGTVYEADLELQGARRACEGLRKEYAEHGARATQIAAELRDEVSDGGAVSESALRNRVRRRVRERLRDALASEGERRAAALGFANTYTYSKCLAESMLHARASELDYAILRPTIVESALRYPFPGWNESFNGSAPLAYVMGSWFRSVPARPTAPFDVIPVDEVCKAMVLCGAALLAGRQREVYQIGTSHRYPCSVGRAAELIVLSHRQHYRKRVRSPAEQVLKSRWDAILVHPDHPLGVDGLTSALHIAHELLDIVPPRLRPKLARLERKVDEIDDSLADIRKMVELYMPFMYENGYVFESRAIDDHPSAEAELAFFPQPMDWRRYWLDVHMPGLRRYAFPLIEGRRPERYRAAHRVSLVPQAMAPRIGGGAAGVTTSRET